MKKILILFFLFCGSIQAEEVEYKTDFSVIDLRTPVNPIYLTCVSDKESSIEHYNPKSRWLLAHKNKLIAEYSKGNYVIYESKFLNYGIVANFAVSEGERSGITIGYKKEIDLNLKTYDLELKIRVVKPLPGRQISFQDATFFYKCKEDEKQD